MVLFFQMSVNVSLSLESSNADEKSKPDLSIFSFRQAYHCLKAYKIPSLSLEYRNFTMMWSDLFLFLEFCPPLSKTFQSENFFSSVKIFFPVSSFIIAPSPFFFFFPWNFYDSHLRTFRYAFYGSSFYF